MLLQADVDYFNRSRRDIPQYWTRFGGKPDFSNRVVVEVGCGLGGLCVDIASSGAWHVIGLDLNPARIDFANENIERHHRDLRDIVEFRCQDLVDMPEGEIDYVVSKDCFEHVMHLERVLAAIKDHLKPGGRLYTGFGPLWNSPFGDHRRGMLPIPWAHVALPEHVILAWRNHLTGRKAASWSDLGLNELPLAEYLRLFRESGMEIVQLEINASKRFVSHLFSLFRELPHCEEFFSHNIYAILEKEAGSVREPAGH